MGRMSLRLSEQLESRLADEARRSGVARSEIARAAIAEFLDRNERKRFLDLLVAGAKTAYRDPAARKQALVIAEEALPLDNEALDLAEGGPRARTGPPAKRRKRDW